MHEGFIVLIRRPLNKDDAADSRERIHDGFMTALTGFEHRISVMFHAFR